MAKVLNINGMVINVIEPHEQDKYLTQDDIDMDIRATAAVRAALKKAKICRKPIAHYDMLIHRAYIENADGTIKFIK